MKKGLFFLWLHMLLSSISIAQSNNIWCFGDSAGINFSNISNPQPIHTSVVSRGTCVSIADSGGQLLFYANTDVDEAGMNSGIVWNKNNEIMMGGDSVAGTGWFHEMIIISNPVDDSSYYLFCIGVSYPYGLMYSLIDMRGDSGLGEITQKNIQLLNLYVVDCLLAIKHGNGRDWWVILREYPVSGGPGNNSWYSFLISPSGISSVMNQQVGTLNPTNLGRTSFCPTTNKICFVNGISLIELYDFDRCSGIISNPINIEQPTTVPFPLYWACEFSVSGQYLYVTSSTNPISKLWQFDTWASNIAASKTLIWQTSYPPYTIGALKRAPNNKIYLSSGWVDSTGFYYFPYEDTMYYSENMNLSVINFPDSAGLSCNFQPWSFHLGGKRTYWGLPNNPDYDLGPLVGSPCDTIVSIPEPQQTTSNFYIYYSLQWQSAFINADKLKGRTYQLRVVDAIGREVHTETGSLSSSYFTRNLNCESFAKGMYVVVIETDKEKLVKKFVVN